MKKFLLFVTLMLMMAISAKGQMYAPCYANYQGVGAFMLPNGYYYGQIYAGYPHGEGYYYFVDPQMGPVYYHGYFSQGLCNGLGEILCNSGYICGTWNMGEFVSQTNVQPQQMQQSYYNAWNNYWNCYATMPSYTPSYNWSWNNYPTPTYNNTPSFFPNTTPSNNYQASSNVKIPSDTRITQIDSDSQLGRQLLGKIGQ